MNKIIISSFLRPYRSYRLTNFTSIEEKLSLLNKLKEEKEKLWLLETERGMTGMFIQETEEGISSNIKFNFLWI